MLGARVRGLSFYVLGCHLLPILLYFKLSTAYCIKHTEPKNVQTTKSIQSIHIPLQSTLAMNILPVWNIIVPNKHVNFEFNMTLKLPPHSRAGGLFPHNSFDPSHKIIVCRIMANDSKVVKQMSSL